MGKRVSVSVPLRVKIPWSYWLRCIDGVPRLVNARQAFGVSAERFRAAVNDRSSLLRKRGAEVFCETSVSGDWVGFRMWSDSEGSV